MLLGHGESTPTVTVGVMMALLPVFDHLGYSLPFREPLADLIPNEQQVIGMAAMLLLFLSAVFDAVAAFAR